MANELTVGAWVFTSDGKELGRVKKVEETAFQIDAPLALDYWLEKALVKEAAAERVDLSIANGAVGGYKMDRPHDIDGFHERNKRDDPAVVRDRTLLR